LAYKAKKNRPVNIFYSLPI